MVENMSLLILQNYGIFWFIILLAIFSFFKWSDIIIPKFKQIFFENDMERVLKTRNIIINKLNYWIKYKIDTMEMRTRGRTEIFRDLMKINMESFLDEFNDESFLMFMNINGELSYREMIESMTNVRNKANQRAIEIGIPNIVVDKFNHWTNPTKQYTIRCAELILHSGVYDKNSEKMVIIYTMLTSMLELMIFEAEKTLSTINGELDGIEYKGYIC